MRVFRSYLFNLASRVPYKDTLAYVEQALMDEGIVYDRLGFVLEHISQQKMDRLLRTYPQLEKYKKEAQGWMGETAYTLTSVSEDWPQGGLRVEKEDEPMLRELIRKIPNPLNASPTSFILENVHWFPTVNAQPCALGTKRPSGQGTGLYLSNHIKLVKEYDYGKKINLVCVMIEVTCDADALLDDAPIVQRLIRHFGNVYRKCRQMFVYEEPQRIARRAQAAQGVQAYIQQINASQVYSQLILSLDTSLGMLDLSPKKALLRLCKRWGYRYAGYENFCYCVQKTNAHHHCFEIQAFMDKGSTMGCRLMVKVLDTEFEIQLNTFYRLTQPNIEAGFEQVFFHAAQIEQRLTPILFEHFGKVPSWYEYSKF